MRSLQQVSTCLVVAFLAVAVADSSTDIRISASRFGVQEPYNSSEPFYVCANGGSRYITVLCETSLNDTVDEHGNITEPIFWRTWPNGSEEVLESNYKHRSEVQTTSPPHTLLGYRFEQSFSPRDAGIFNLTCKLNATDGNTKESDAIEIRVESDPDASPNPRIYFLNDVEMRDGQIIEGQDLVVATDLCCDTSNQTHDFSCSLKTVGQNGQALEDKTTAPLSPRATIVNYYYNVKAGAIFNCSIIMHPESTCEQKEFILDLQVVSRDPPTTTPDPSNTTRDPSDPGNGGLPKTNLHVPGIFLLVLSTLALSM